MTTVRWSDNFFTALSGSQFQATGFAGGKVTCLSEKFG